MKKLFSLIISLVISILCYSQTTNLHNVALKAAVDQQCRATLNWVVQIEDHVDYYVVETGFDIYRLDSIHHEIGGVWSLEPTQYSWKDTAVIDETKHYRIKTVYWDGTYEYSNMVAARCWRKD